MRFFVATLLAVIYASQALMGHAGLHLLSGHSHFLAQESSDTESRIVSCFHAPGDESPCEHDHHCSHHHTSSSSDEPPVHEHHGDHDEDDCQICHHLAHAAVPFVPACLMVEQGSVLPLDMPQERFYHAVVVALPQTRGPPAFFA
jgi:hypothetical protein